MRTISRVLVLSFLLAALSAFTLNAQTFRGTLLGTVTDATGAVIPGAAISVKNMDTGIERTTASNSDGAFTVPELPVGRYSASVTMTGFNPYQADGLEVTVGSQVNLNIVLQTGSQKEEVIVSGNALQVETTSNTLGETLTTQDVKNLPINGRDYTKLIYLSPGVSGSPDQISDSPGSFGAFSVNGARGRSNNFLLDGTDMNDGYRNDPALNEPGVFGAPATILPIDAVSELRVLSNFEAEYGRSAGAVINIVTKSGTNAIHGSGFDFFRNTDLNARNYFNSTVNQDTGGPNPQDPFHDNQFGGALGGPIVKDKTFFYVDYEGVREAGAESLLACVPTTVDIANATAAIGGTVNPVIASLLSSGKAWPTPNIGGSCITAPGDLVSQTFNADNTSLSTRFSNRVDSAIVKIDDQVNATNLLTGRYYIGDSTQLFPLALTGGGSVPNYDTLTPTRVQLIAVSFVSTISPSATSEVRVGWNRFAEGFFPQDRSFNPSSIGLDNTSFSSSGLDPYNFGLPVVEVGPFAQLGSSESVPRQRVDTNWHYIDNISWKHGKHDIKFGYEFRRTSISQIFNEQARGSLEFNSLDSFLEGIPDGGGSQVSGNTNRNSFENSHAAYFQDSYRWKRNFTFNFGLRYDYFGIVQDKQGNFTNIDPNTGALILVGEGRLYQPDYNNWAPRVSVAWDVSGDGKTVVRAGYGVFYDALSQDVFEGHLPFNSGFDPGPEYNGFGPNPISTAN